MTTSMPGTAVAAAWASTASSKLQVTTAGPFTSDATRQMISPGWADSSSADSREISSVREARSSRVQTAVVMGKEFTPNT